MLTLALATAIASLQASLSPLFSRASYIPSKRVRSDSRRDLVAVSASSVSSTEAFKVSESSCDNGAEAVETVSSSMRMDSYDSSTDEIASARRARPSCSA